ncbi:hypothetical protein [Sinorhizobium sp. RAC02]|uniref:hypothetical protein n=1 Tax=Sinorhizobium sp. RAC02 TaxID=1842534 RepID=UPI00123770DA|nr:hypothetical protein [Sinorhizobium sp. RAC02]
MKRAYEPRNGIEMVPEKHKTEETVMKLVKLMCRPPSPEANIRLGQNGPTSYIGLQGYLGNDHVRRQCRDVDMKHVAGFTSWVVPLITISRPEGSRSPTLTFSEAQSFSRRSVQTGFRAPFATASNSLSGKISSE